MLLLYVGRQGHPITGVLWFLVVVLVFFLSSVDSVTTITTKSEEMAETIIVNSTAYSSFADRKAALHTAIQNATSAQRSNYVSFSFASLDC